jgi:phosphatidylethanolamine/phosphatidyl-N-methylethanolamine N-methyltransferase
MASGTLIFLRRLINNPVQVSAIAPSSVFLARAMAAGITPDTGRVVEFGPGTGKLTDGILAMGLPPENLTCFELDPIFVRHLLDRLPRVTIVHAGADTAPDHVAPGVDRVISGLPLLSMPRPVREAIVGAAFKILAPGGVYVQFTYGQKPALDPAQLEALGLQVRFGPKVWLNLPPARVLYYSRIGEG